MTEQVVSTLRSVLKSESENAVAPGDPWPQFVRRERSHRRRRRAGALAVAALAVGGIQLNVVPLPDATPRFALASSKVGLADGPTRGSLAADTVWLDEFRGRIADSKDGDGLWRVIHSRIKFVYAGDAGGKRLVVAVVPHQLGVLADSTTMWFRGPVGATPSQMDNTGKSDGIDAPVATYMSGDARSGGLAVVVGPAGSTVRINTDFSYTAAGTVEHRSAGAPGDGVGVASIPPGNDAPGITTEVTAGGRTLYRGPVYGGWESAGIAGHADQDPTDAMLAAAARDARGPGLDPVVLRTFVTDTLDDSHLAASAVSIRLRWTGTVDGEPAALLTVQPRNGGVLAYAMHGTAVERQRDLRLLMPAAGADRRPIGWRLTNSTDPATDRLMVVAPPGATNVTVTLANGPATTINLDSTGAGTTTIPTGKEATLTAYTAAGAVLGTGPVHIPERNSDGLPGDSPLTRITK